MLSAVSLENPDETGSPRGPKKGLGGGVGHLPSILKSLVPQDEQVPCNALRPFLRRTSWGADISLFVFSLRQYASVMD